MDMYFENQELIAYMKTLKALVDENPNDQDLGKKVREFFQNVENM